MPRRLDEFPGWVDVDLDHLVPPPRFGTVRFASFVPQHPSQAAARSAVERLVDAVAEPVAAGRRFSLFRPRASERVHGRGLYLDGGFGVGKTHLLAAAFHAAPVREKRYLTFQELVYLIGVLGMPRTREVLAGARLLCVDEFELDDPGNTLIVKTFLASAFDRGATVLTTANTSPEAQGTGRFNAGDFRREIQSMASRFEVVRLDGPDARPRHGAGTLLSDDELITGHDSPNFVYAEWDELLEHLSRHHPSRYRAQVAAMDGLVVRGARTIGDQNDALRFVHFVDSAYDHQLVWYLSGADEEPFDASYRHGAYAAKYGRCRSRLAELSAEARAHASTVTGAGRAD